MHTKVGFDCYCGFSSICSLSNFTGNVIRLSNLGQNAQPSFYAKNALLSLAKAVPLNKIKSVSYFNIFSKKITVFVSCELQQRDMLWSFHPFSQQKASKYTVTS